MPPRAWSFRLRDILDSIGAIEEYVSGMTYEQFAQDRRTVDAVIRNLGIIGEAANHVPAEVQDQYPAMWRRRNGRRRQCRGFDNPRYLYETSARQDFIALLRISCPDS